MVVVVVVFHQGRDEVLCGRHCGPAISAVWTGPTPTPGYPHCSNHVVVGVNDIGESRSGVVGDHPGRRDPYPCPITCPARGMGAPIAGGGCPYKVHRRVTGDCLGCFGRGRRGRGRTCRGAQRAADGASVVEADNEEASAAGPECSAWLPVGRPTRGAFVGLLGLAVRYVGWELLAAAELFTVSRNCYGLSLVEEE